MWQLAGIVAATDRLAAPAVILVSPSTFENEHAAVAPAFAAYLRHLNSRLLIQADHLPNVESVLRAWCGNVDAVLSDGSRMTLKDNSLFAREARAVASRPGAVGIEAELGRIDGSEDRLSAEKSGKLTNPDDVVEFVERSGIDCLAVSIGNRHGVYVDPPNLDWDRLAAIREATPIPLALHGASGLSEDDLRRAVDNGIGKINFNTELRDSYFAELRRRVPQHEASLDLAALGMELTEATAKVVESKLRLLGWGNAR